MSLSRQARIEVEPARVTYPAWWLISVSYETIPTVVAAIDILWILALSGASGFVYPWASYPWIASVQVFDPTQMIGVGLAAAAMFATAAQARGIYRPSNLLRTRSQIAAACAIWSSTLLCLLTIAFALKIGHMFSRGAVLLFFGAGLAAIAVVRILVAALIRRIIASERLSLRRVVLLVDACQVPWCEIVRPFERYGYAFLRVFDISAAPRGIEDKAEIAEQMAGVLRYIRQRCPDEIILALPWDRSPVIRQVAHELRSVPMPVRLLTDRHIEWLLERPWQDLGPTRAVELQGTPLNGVQRAAKRLFDIALASSSLVVLVPIFAIIALLIRLDSPGPIVFQQGRVGFNGRAFRIYKFRTMTVLEDGPTVRQVSRNDQRVTRVGRVLRRFSLDELPQLLNVLRGEMSIVGPRPHALAHDDQYSQLIAEYATRHKVKPGITGWAQINGCRGETPQVDMMKRRVTYDLWYIDYWSLWLDLRIIVRTALQVIRDRNVY